MSIRLPSNVVGWEGVYAKCQRFRMTFSLGEPLESPNPLFLVK